MYRIIIIGQGSFHVIRVMTGPLYTWDAGTQRHKGNGRDRVPKAHCAAQVGGQVPQHGRQESDHEDRNGK